MAIDKTRRDTLAITEKDKEKPSSRDRDQSVNSPERAHDKADRAEYSETTGAQEKSDPGEPLISRDNLKDTPPPSGSS